MKDYRIAIHPFPDQVRVSYNGVELAKTRNALLLDETGHNRVFYIPLADVRMELLEHSQHQTHCPLKGDASYWSLKLPGEEQENLIWAYQQPFAEVAEIAGHVAFYQDRVDIKIGE